MKCANCGQEVKYHPDDAVYLHKWDRWNGDNGYYCDLSMTRFASNYKVRLDRDEFGNIHRYRA